jgi:predicted TIM-barrel enzyme
MKIIAALFVSLAPALAWATPPEACSLLTPEEINAFAERKVERAVVQQSGNPSKCGYMDARHAAVLVVTVREVQYAARDEMHYERENLEKIYRSRAKQLDTIGEGGYWLPANKQLTFRKGKMIASVIFATTRNQNEVDSSQVARLVESRLPK